jgi:hypothetical protein
MHTTSICVQPCCSAPWLLLHQRLGSRTYCTLCLLAASQEESKQYPLIRLAVPLLPRADAATASNSILKVILASSIVSIMWDWWERGPDYLYSGAEATQQQEDWLSPCLHMQERGTKTYMLCVFRTLPYTVILRADGLNLWHGRGGTTFPSL